MAKFYIQDTRSYVGNSVLWWRPDSSGYTTELTEAGEYDEDEARKIEAGRDTDRAIPVDVAKAVASTHVRGDRLRAAMPERGPMPTAEDRALEAEREDPWSRFA